MKRPDRVKVGHLTFLVGWYDQATFPHAGKQGVMHGSKETIDICYEDDDGPISEGNLREVFLHEILHAIWHSVDNLPELTWNDHDYEERLILAQTPPLLAVLRDNPEVRDYLCG